MLYGMQDLARNMIGLGQTAIQNGPQPSGLRTESIGQGTGVSGEQSVKSVPATFSESHVSDGGVASSLRSSEFWALQGINFELKRGQCLGLIGQNGSGKSTLLRLLAGIFPPDTGEIVVRGRVGAMIALGAGFHPHMTGRENVFLNGAILGLNRREISERFDEIVAFAELGDFIDAPVATYSSGMTVRLGFAIAAHTSPELLIIDEVFAVGDLGFRVKCLNKIEKLIKGCSVVFVSHSMTQIAAIANRVMVLDHGQVALLSDNIAAGIEGYYQEFDPGVASHLGDGRVKLLSSKLIVPDRPSEGAMLQIRRGDSLQVNLALMIDSAIPLVHVRIGIANAEMRPIAEVDTEVEGGGILNRAPITQVSALIHGLNLNSGRYTVHVHVTDAATKERLLRAGCVAEFQAAFLASSGADFMLPCEWT